NGQNGCSSRGPISRHRMNSLWADIIGRGRKTTANVEGPFMPVLDWTRVDAGIFHDFHHEWISTIKRTLNAGLLPPDHYALAEQIAGGLGPDVLTLQGPTNGAPKGGDARGGVALATTPPQVYFHARTEIDIYAAKAKVVAIRHTSNHRVVAVVE